MVVFSGSKRGVSPLIATVLLIAFAVAIGAVVMNWGRGYVEESDSTAPAKAGCDQNIIMSVVEISGKKQLCVNSATGTVDFTLQNDGEVNIEGMKVQVFGEKRVVENDLSVSLGQGSVAKNAVQYSESESGALQQVRFIPKIKVDGSDKLCTLKALIKEKNEVGVC